MKRFLSAVLVLFAFSFALAGDIPGVPVPDAPSAVEAVVVAATPGILAQVWAYVNSSAGITVLGGIIIFILGKLLQAKPEWQVVYAKYFPTFMLAVKAAEKAIPDGTMNVGLARLDWACKEAIRLEPELAKLGAGVLSQAVSAVHAVAEANENI